jgi:hypothetical protein
MISMLSSYAKQRYKLEKKVVNMAKGVRLNIKALKKLAPAGTTNNGSEFSSLISRGTRIRQKGMNKTETLFSKLLEGAQAKGEIIRWHFESITLKIAPNTRYIPDFVAVLPNGHWQVFEIKGHLEDDAAVKFKAAAEKFPEISFHMLSRKKGEWKTIYNIPSPYNTKGYPPTIEEGLGDLET